MASSFRPVLALWLRWEVFFSGWLGGSVFCLKPCWGPGICQAQSGADGPPGWPSNCASPSLAFGTLSARCRLPAQWSAGLGVGIPHQLLTNNAAFSAATPEQPLNRAGGANWKLGNFCRRLPRCPQVVPPTARPGASGSELASPLEAGLCSTPESAPSWVAPEPLAATLSLISGRRRGRRPVLCWRCSGRCSNPESPRRVGTIVREPNPLPSVGSGGAAPGPPHSRHARAPLQQ